jgi:hypothetical protein
VVQAKTARVSVSAFPVARWRDNKKAIVFSCELCSFIPSYLRHRTRDEHEFDEDSGTRIDALQAQTRVSVPEMYELKKGRWICCLGISVDCIWRRYIPSGAFHKTISILPGIVYIQKEKNK